MEPRRRRLAGDDLDDVFVSSAYCPHFIEEPAMTQLWSDVLFVSWPVPVNQLAARLPAGLQPDVWNDSAWISFVPFKMENIEVRGRRVPRGSFPEVNVRAYVLGPEGPGVWFSSLDVPSLLPLGVANAIYGLNYRWSSVARAGNAKVTEWSVRRRFGRATGAVRGRIGSPVPPSVLDLFLTARWRLYAGRKKLVTARVEHEPWPLHSVEVDHLDLGLVRDAGFDPRVAPVARWSPGVSVKVERPREPGSDRR